MDLLDLVKRKVEGLPKGAHSDGLRSVIRHIEAAERHLSRGESDQDDSLFTDAIYRTNQAFEGSIKEAYRVLAGKDPDKTKPYDIEQYLKTKNVFRDRVLDQFSSYRTKWRNPSAHDYNLDFDEDEALLAIISVTAFAKVLIDEISVKLAFAEVTEELSGRVDISEVSGNSLNIASEALNTIRRFVEEYLQQDAPASIITEPQILGALVAYVTRIMPQVVVSVEEPIRESGHIYRADMIIRGEKDSVIIEIKRTPPVVAFLDQAVRRLSVVIDAANSRSGILLCISRDEDRYKVLKLRRKDGVILHIICSEGFYRKSSVQFAVRLSDLGEISVVEG